MSPRDVAVLGERLAAVEAVVKRIEPFISHVDQEHMACRQHCDAARESCRERFGLVEIAVTKIQVKTGFVWGLIGSTIGGIIVAGIIGLITYFVTRGGGFSPPPLP